MIKINDNNLNLDEKDKIDNKNDMSKNLSKKSEKNCNQLEIPNEFDFLNTDFAEEVPKCVRAVIHKIHHESSIGETARSLTPRHSIFSQVNQEEADAEAFKIAQKHYAPEKKEKEVCGDKLTKEWMRELVSELTSVVGDEGDDQKVEELLEEPFEDEVRNITENAIVDGIERSYPRTMKILKKKRTPIRLILPEELPSRFYSIYTRWAKGEVETVFVLLGDILETKDEIVVLVNRFGSKRSQNRL